MPGRVQEGDKGRGLLQRSGILRRPQGGLLGGSERHLESSDVLWGCKWIISQDVWLYYDFETGRDSSE